jgi:predicted nucleic acid-binding protein
VPSFLIDKSALARRTTRTEVREALDPHLLKGEVSTCGIVDLEFLYSSTSPRVYSATAAALRAMPRAPLDEECVDRALEVQAMLAERSQHRAVPLPDLLVAACAERAGLAVLHYDADFDRIAELTGQAAQWIVPRGSVA